MAVLKAPQPFFRQMIFVTLIAAACLLHLHNLYSAKINHMIRKWEYEQHAKFPGRDFGEVPKCDQSTMEPTELERQAFYRSWLTNLKSNNADTLVGVELGALHRPAPVPEFCSMTYVDGDSVESLRNMYPELKSHNLSKPHLIDRAETLALLSDNSFNFLIASHLLEHTKNMLLALKNQIRVIKPGGYIFIAVPNMCKTFDRGRLLTRIQHIYEEFLNTELSAQNEEEHQREFVLSTKKGSALTGIVVSNDDITKMAAQSLRTGYHIHYHTFTPESFLNLLTMARELLAFDILMFMQQNLEIWCVLRKI